MFKYQKMIEGVKPLPKAARMLGTGVRLTRLLDSQAQEFNNQYRFGRWVGKSLSRVERENPELGHAS